MERGQLARPAQLLGRAGGGKARRDGVAQALHAVPAPDQRLQALAPRYAGQPVVPLPGRILAPGFVDMHIHFPQTDVIASPADGLLPWLEQHTYPQETRFAAPGHCAQVAQFFIAELLRNGVSTALAFGSSHPASVDALFAEARRQQMR
ncbi:amidohydrolase family protein, partial [Verminephrobacter sp. Larva24]